MAPGLTTIAFSGLPVLGSVLSTIGLVLLWTLAAVLAVLLVLLIVPIHVRAEGGIHGMSLSGKAAIRWGWGLVSVRMAPGSGFTLHVLGIRIWTFTGSDEPEPEKPEEPKKKGRKGPGLRWFLEYRRHAWKLLKRLLDTLRLRLRVTGELGLGDPADTALLAALLGELERSQELVELEVQPDWLDETIELDGDLGARIWPIHIGLILLGALLRKDTRRMMRAAR
jgi:hypothetical protein